VSGSSDRAPVPRPLDELDRRILQVLERDAQTDPRQIAIMLDLTPENVGERIANAEANGAIVRRKVVVNWEQAGEPFVLALIEVKVTPQRETGFDAIAERIYRFPEARSVYLVSGTYDLAVHVVGRTMQDVATFVAEKLAPLDGVQSTVTHFMLRRYKEDGDILVGHETAERLAVTP
jgi:DNA-binding Lrp family transcriptional regulator